MCLDHFSFNDSLLLHSRIHTILAIPRRSQRGFSLVTSLLHSHTDTGIYFSDIIPYTDRCQEPEDGTP